MEEAWRRRGGGVERGERGAEGSGGERSGAEGSGEERRGADGVDRSGVSEWVGGWVMRGSLFFGGFWVTTLQASLPKVCLMLRLFSIPRAETWLSESLGRKCCPNTTTPTSASRVPSRFRWVNHVILAVVYVLDAIFTP